MNEVFFIGFCGVFLRVPGRVPGRAGTCQTFKAGDLQSEPLISNKEK